MKTVVDWAPRDIPELSTLEGGSGSIRIPPELDVPMTSRVRAIVDTAPFRRLASISQLGLVPLVYPAAHHRRFEHSLGVFRLGLLTVRQLLNDVRFQELAGSEDVELFLVACLLHDIGHWPFCHLIEDLQLATIPSHEDFARHWLVTGELADVLRSQWNTTGTRVADFLAGNSHSPCQRVLLSLLSGPIDVDKMDYLMRDSLHAGVPYGRNFDQGRLIGSLCLNAAGDGIALTDKGRTAAEMMVFARYVMFSEVYWHHAVRAATAMMQRLFFVLHSQLDLMHLFGSTETDFIATLTASAHETPVASLVEGLFGAQRKLYKRWIQTSYFEHPELYAQLAHRPYAWLVRCGAELASQLSAALGRAIHPEQVLIDGPPRKLEVQFDVDIRDERSNVYRRLVDVSPVVRTLAEKQFDDYVKRVRVFVDPALLGEMQQLEDPLAWLQRAVARMPSA